MKNFIVTLLAIACFAILIAGNSHWKKLGAKEEGQTIVNVVKPPEKQAVSEQTKPAWEFENETVNWLAESRESFRNATESKRPFKIALAGSEALGKEPDGWAYLLKNELLDTYGQKNIEVTVVETNTNTRDALGAKWQKEIIDSGPDMVVLEPLLLNDNGKVFMEESLKNITAMIEGVMAQLPDTTFILQPANPIYKPKYYLTQVQELEKYSKEKGHVYLNHWEEWPDPNSEEIKSYLNQQTSQPNAEGHKLWGEYVIKYFTGK